MQTRTIRAFRAPPSTSEKVMRRNALKITAARAGGVSGWLMKKLFSL